MDDVMGLIDRAHHGDERARAQLVEQNMGLVWSIVRRFSGRGTENEDLFQIGAIGLMKAIDKFDCSFEVRFSTYAVPMIMGEIKGRWSGEGESYIKGKWMEDPAGDRELSESVGEGAYLGGTGRSYCTVQRRDRGIAGCRAGGGVY